MIKLLEDLLIEATTNPNVLGSLVAGLHKAVETARGAALPPWPRRDKDGKVYDVPGAFEQLASHPAVRSAIIGVTNIPYDGEGWIDRKSFPIPDNCGQVEVSEDPEAARWRPIRQYRVCVKAHETNVGNTVPVGHVAALESDESLQQPDCWAPCDKDGWAPAAAGFIPGDLKVEFRGSRDEGANPTDWRPARASQVSAIDEMAEQMKRWATSTREPVAWFDKDGKIQGRVSDEQLDALCSQALADLEARNGREASLKWQEDAHFESVKAAPALAVQEGGSHYKSMKIQPVEYIHANDLGYSEGNVVKYVSRWRAKGGLQDLKKARHYLDLLIELEGGVK